jgi:hypothetical protein
MMNEHLPPVYVAATVCTSLQEGEGTSPTIFFSFLCTSLEIEFESARPG